VTSARLGSAIERLREKLLSRRNGLSEEKTLRIRDGENTTLLPIADIDYVNAAGDYMVISAGNSTLIHRTTLSRLADELAPSGIVRIHRSTLVAPDRILRLVCGANGDGEVVLHDGTRLRYSRSFREALHEAIGLEE
jgi:two-component system LytT family response regulator